MRQRCAPRSPSPRARRSAAAARGGAVWNRITENSCSSFKMPEWYDGACTPRCTRVVMSTSSPMMSTLSSRISVRARLSCSVSSGCTIVIVVALVSFRPMRLELPGVDVVRVDLHERRRPDADVAHRTLELLGHPGHPADQALVLALTRVARRTVAVGHARPLRPVVVVADGLLDVDQADQRRVRYRDVIVLEVVVGHDLPVLVEVLGPPSGALGTCSTWRPEMFSHSRYGPTGSEHVFERHLVGVDADRRPVRRRRRRGTAAARPGRGRGRRSRAPTARRRAGRSARRSRRDTDSASPNGSAPMPSRIVEARCRQTFDIARSSPSCPRTTTTGSRPTLTVTYCPGSASSET